MNTEVIVDAIREIIPSAILVNVEFTNPAQDASEVELVMRDPSREKDWWYKCEYSNAFLGALCSDYEARFFFWMNVESAHRTLPNLAQ